MSDGKSPAHLLAVEVLKLARARGERLATAESCTGGLVSAALTDIAGSSDVFDRGYITYSNDAKQAMLGVPDKLLKGYGAVSAEVAAAMALGVLKVSGAHLAVAITGIAGPGGGTAKKPVGLVHFAAAHRDGRVDRVEKRFGNLGRAEVRARSLETALQMLRDLLSAPMNA